MGSGGSTGGRYRSQRRQWSIHTKLSQHFYGDLFAMSGSACRGPAFASSIKYYSDTHSPASSALPGQPRGIIKTLKKSHVFAGIGFRRDRRAACGAFTPVGFRGFRLEGGRVPGEPPSGCRLRTSYLQAKGSGGAAGRRHSRGHAPQEDATARRRGALRSSRRRAASSHKLLVIP